MPHRHPAALVFEDGRRFHGLSYGTQGHTFGTAAYVTRMTGYQETITDPAHKDRILVLATPHIGNTGVNEHDASSDSVTVAGLVVRDPSRVVSNFRAEGSLDDLLLSSSVISIAQIDTRAIVKHLVATGPLVAGIFSGPTAMSDDEQLRAVKAHAQSLANNNPTEGA